MDIQETVNKICSQLPEYYTISLDIDSETFYIALARDGQYIKLPDNTHKTLIKI